MPLTRDQIVAAAIRLVDDEGADALSMRRLGDALGAGAASVYWHVPSKEALLDLVADEVIGEAFDGFRAPAEWRAWMAAAARAMHGALRRHPGVAPIIARRPPTGAHALAAAGRLMDLLHDDGFDARGAVLASTTLFAWASMSGVMNPAASTTARDDVLADPAATAAATLAGLPAEAHPSAARLAEGVAGLTAGELFEYGLAALLDGVAAGERRRRAAGG